MKYRIMITGRDWDGRVGALQAEVDTEWIALNMADDGKMDGFLPIEIFDVTMSNNRSSVRWAPRMGPEDEIFAADTVVGSLLRRLRWRRLRAVFRPQG